MRIFKSRELKKLYRPDNNSSGEENGQVTIIGGSKLFHGAPILSLKVASRIVDMVFFATPEKSVGYVAEQIKSQLMSFIWVPWEEVDDYIKKSDAVLIGPGFMRFGRENQKSKIKDQNDNLKLKKTGSADLDEEGRFTRDITKKLLTKFPHKKWVIDAGSLQTMEADWIPEGAIVTPNQKEFELLFGERLGVRGQSLAENNKLIFRLQSLAAKHKCVIVVKGPETLVASADGVVVVKGGNAGMTKGGAGDVLAGLTVALLAKNDPLLSACAASFIEKKAADELYKKVATNYNADDLTNEIPNTINKTL